MIVRQKRGAHDTPIKARVRIAHCLEKCVDSCKLDRRSCPPRIGYGTSRQTTLVFTI